jgi:hypothetical protein
VVVSLGKGIITVGEGLLVSVTSFSIRRDTTSHPDNKNAIKQKHKNFCRIMVTLSMPVLQVYWQDRQSQTVKRLEMMQAFLVRLV